MSLGAHVAGGGLLLDRRDKMGIDAMFRSLILAIPLLAVGAAPLLAQPPEVPQADLYKQQQSRAIAIQNRSSQSIVSAQVQTTPDGKTWQLGHGTDIARNQANETIVPAKDCIAKVTVQLKDGKTLSASGLNACRDTQIVVRDEGVGIAQQAVPGANTR